MSYIETEVRGHIIRRIYLALDEREAREFANIWSGYAYESMPDYWVVII
ncbi:MAG TPA: hypothetical protein VFU05_02415 [Cyclobacteriaceae bacterium]|nr:hypothetical protein [Cyclobacteriaceae bacterium]